MSHDPRAPGWRVSAITLHPEIWPGPLGASRVGGALGRVWSLETIDLREHGVGPRREVDARPFGGGPGMTLRADVAVSALDAARAEDDVARPMIGLSARGRPAARADIRRWASAPGAIFLCGRFEGIDARVFEARAVEEICVGEFIMAGGDIAAMALVEAAARLLPGVMGRGESAAEESFENDLLEYPQYAKPRAFEGRATPAVLLSGDPAAVARWRETRALADTRARRPDLWRRHVRRDFADADPPRGVIDAQALRDDRQTR